MKYNIGLIISVILACTLVSCKDIYENDYLSTSSEYCTFPAEGGIQYIEIVSTSDYSVSQPEAEWCTVSLAYGKIAVQAISNSENVERSCKFSITPDFAGGMREITVIQAPAGEIILDLSDTSSVHVFDAMGGNYSLSVRSDVSWTAEMDSEYYTLETEASSMVLTVKAPVNNSDENHDAILTIVAGTGSAAAVRQIAISQLTKSQSPYYRFTGEWDMYCSSWILGQETISDGGTHTSCSIVEVVPGESYEIRGLFYDSGTVYTVIPAYFNPETGRMEIEVGEQTSLFIYGTFPVYLMMCNMDTNSLLYDRLLACTVSEDGNKIEIDGFENGYGWGIFPYMNGGYSRMVDLYYAADDDSYFIRSQN